MQSKISKSNKLTFVIRTFKKYGAPIKNMQLFRSFIQLVKFNGISFWIPIVFVRMFSATISAG